MFQGHFLYHQHAYYQLWQEILPRNSLLKRAGLCAHKGGGCWNSKQSNITENCRSVMLPNQR